MDYDVVAGYLKAKSPVIALLDKRISFEGRDDDGGSISITSTSRGKASFVAILLLIVVYC